jgi:filamentous hemagglutinin family protein
MTLVHNPRLSASGRARRFALLTSTALVGVSLNLAAPALAQTLPIPTGLEVIAGSGEWNNGGAKITTPAADLRTVDLLAKSRIIDFTSYNIDSATVNYISTGGGANLVAANRVVGSGASTITSTGKITADPNISVWLINQDGITFNGTATLTSGSLMLSTLGFTSTVNPAFRTAFETTANTSAISFSGSSTNPITIGGAGLSVSGSIVVVGQDITNNASVTSTGGSVVMIAGSDVTFTAGLGNPLSFTVNAGTDLGQAAVNINKNVTGQSVLIAGGLKTNLTAALLNVDANAKLTASVAGGTVTLATATTTVGTNTATITNGTNAAPSILVNGSLAATGSSADVIVNSAAGVTLANAVTAGRDFKATGTTVTLGAAATTVSQSAGRNVTINATTDDIIGLGTLSLKSDTGGTGAADLVLKADAGEVDFGANTLLQAGLTGADPLKRSVVRITSGPAITLGDVIASGLVSGAGTALEAADAITTGDVTVDQALTMTSTGGSISTGKLTVGNANAAVLLSAAGADSDISASDTIATNGGNVLLSAENDISIGDVTTVLAGPGTPTGSIGLLAGGAITGGKLNAGVDIAARAGAGVDIARAIAGDDIDLVALSGTLTLDSSTAKGTGAVDTRVTLAGTAGASGSLDVVSGEDAQLGESTIRLRSAAGDITSGTGLSALAGDVLVNASRDVSLVSANATGGSVAVRAGRDVTQANTLTSNDEDVTVGAGRNATLGTVKALDDIDLDITGSLNFTKLTLTGGTDGTRFADVTSGSAGAVAGLSFTTPDDPALAGANVVRIKAGSVGTPGAASNALIVKDAAGNPASGAFSFTADQGDIRIGTATADGNIGVTATLGSVTGLADGYAAPTGGEIAAGTHKVLLDVGSGSFGAITASTLTQITTPTILRARSITADAINLVAINTLDLGTVRTAGTLTLQTTGGTAATGTTLEINAPVTKLAEGFGAATLTAKPADALITVNAVQGIAQLGTLTAGTGADPDPATGAAGQITVNARALTIATAIAKDGGISATASDGLLQVGTGTAKQLIALTKQNLDGTSTGSDTTTDLLRAANLTSTAGSIDLLSETSVSVTTQAKAAIDLKISAAKDIGITTGEATAGSLGLLAGGAITATTLTAGSDIAVQGGTSGALLPTNVTITSATAGDDIDVAALNGDLTLDNGLSNNSPGARGTSVSFGTPGAAGSITVASGGEAQLGESTIRLRSAAGDIASATSLSTTAGDVLVNASNDVSLTAVTATGGSVVVRAGRDVTQANTLTSNDEDVTVGAGRNATLGTVKALDDIDLDITGSLNFTKLSLTGGTDGTRFADVTTGSAGAVAGLSFTTPDAAALTAANVVRIKAGSVGTPGAASNALIAGDVNSGTFTANADAGDIRLRNITAAGNLSATATLGSVTGVADGYTPTSASNIVDANGKTVLIDVGSGAFGTINGGLVKTVTSGATVLRINKVNAGTIDLAASNTLDVGTIIASGQVDLATTGGTAATGTTLEINAPATKLAEGFGAATLTAKPADALITVNAVQGIAQLGTLTAGTGADPDPATGAAGQITVNARALTIATAIAKDGGISATASDGLLQVGTGTAKQLIALTKQNLDGTSTGSDTTTDLLRVANLTSTAGSIQLLSDTSADVTTQALAAIDLKISAAKAIGIATGVATTGSIGMLAGGSVSATTLISGTDIGIQGGTSGASPATNVTITSATAGDDVDVAALNGNLSLTIANAKGTGPRGSRVRLAGLPGTSALVEVVSGEVDGELGTSTIRLRSATGDVTSATNLTAADGTIIATAFRDVSITKGSATGGNIFGSAGRDANLVTGNASGSIGLLAGGAITGTTLVAGVDIRAQGGTAGALTPTPITITSATAGDDIDLVAINGDVNLATGLSKNTSGARGTSVTFGTPGAAGSVAVASSENAALGQSTISLRSVTGDVISTTNLSTTDGDIIATAFRDVSITRGSATGGNILGSAGRDASLVTGNASGSIGLLAGATATGGTLNAGVDIAALAGTGVSITSGTAGDDIDLQATTGNVSLITGRSTNAAGARGTSVTFGTPGAAGSVAVASGEDAQLTASTIRMRSVAGDVLSTTNLSTADGDIIATAFRDVSITRGSATGGNILGSAGRDATLVTGNASGSIGLLAGATATGGTLNAGVDIAALAGTGVSITSGTAGDDIDLQATTGNVSLITGRSTNAAGSRGTSVTFGTPGAAGSVKVDSGEVAALLLSSINLRALSGDVVSTTSLTTSAGDIVASASRDVRLTSATATGGNLLGSAGRDVNVATGNATGSIGLLAANTVTGGTLIAGVDVAAKAGNGVTITSATAGDDIDLLTDAGDINLTTGLSNGVIASRGSSVSFATPGAVGSVTVANSEPAELALSTIRLRAATGNVTSTNSLATSRGNIVATASRDITLATARATGGNLLASAGRNVGVTTGNATGSIGLLAGGTVTAGTLGAGVDVAAKAGTGIAITSATAGDDIDLLANTGAVSLTTGLSNGTASARGTSVTFGTPGAVASVGVASGEDSQLAKSTIRLRAAAGDVTSTTSLTAADGDVTAAASRDITLATARATRGNLLASAGRNVGVTTGNASGSIGLLAGGTVTAGTLGAGVDVAAKAGTGIAITSATAGDDIDLLANAGAVSLATGLSNGTASARGTSVTFGTPGAVGSVGVASGEDSQFAKSTIRLRAAAGDVTSTTSLTAADGDVTAAASRDITLATARATGGNLLASAGRNVGVTTGNASGSIGLLAGGTVTAGTLGAGVDVAAKAGTGIAITSATAGDDIDLLANAGAVSLATGLSNGTASARGTSVTFGTPGAVASVGVASGEDSQLVKSTIRLRAAAGDVTSATSLTAADGDVIANAALKVTLGKVNAAGGSVAALTGSEFRADTITASEDVAVATKGNLTVTTSLAAGDDISLSAVDTVTVGSGGASIKGTATGANTRSATLTLSDAGKLPGVQFGAETGTTGNTITVEGSDVAINGTINALTGTILLRNTGTGSVSVGDVASSSTAKFKVDNTEFGRLAAGSVIVDTGNKALEIGTLDLSEATGKDATRLLGTGNDIKITGVVTVKGTGARTLQIGGQVGDPGKADTLASQILMVTDGAQPKILGPSATIDLRGEKILFGTAALHKDILGNSDEAIALKVASADSLIYTDFTALPVGVFMTAKSMKISYKNFALFQNTRVSSSNGVEINSTANGLPNQSDLALQLFSTGDSPAANSFAMFGVVNNFRLNTAALLTNKVIQLSEPADANNISRVNRSNSRINGCVIGAPDKGCLTTDVAQPKFNFYDERKVALFDADNSATIAVSPLIGRGNDGLIVDVANAPVDIDSIECRPDDSTCTANKGN